MQWRWLMAQAMEFLAKGVAVLAFLIAGGVFILRIFGFLKNGAWPSVDSMIYAQLFGIYDRIVSPQDWQGAAAIGRFFFSLPLEVVTLALGVALFFLLASLSQDFSE